jgi:hypothetical protein
MVRRTFGLGVVAILLASAGCRMCGHPYDYCGPVYDSGDCQPCGSHSRAGSILSGTPEITSSPDLAERGLRGKTMSPASLRNEVQGEMRPGDVPGSERIVSVTDRVVEPSTPSADSPQVSADLSTEPSKSLPAKGWMARRPTSDFSR